VYLRELSGPGEGEIGLNNVQCQGNEKSSLLECKHSDWGVNDCNHDRDVWIMCANGK